VVELKPLLVTRLSNALVWPVLAVVLVITLVGREVPIAVVVVGGIASLAVAGYLGLLGWRVGVVCDEAGIEVRGLIRTRRISREEIVAITRFPAVRWTTVAGKARWTPIFAFANPIKLVPFVDRHNEAATAILQDWQAGPKPPKPRRRTRRR
jgi:hypothetical protein